MHVLQTVLQQGIVAYILCLSWTDKANYQRGKNKQ